MSDLDNQKIKDEAWDSAIKKANGCNCHETIKKTGSVCTYCRNENIKDFNYIENMLGVIE